MAQRMSDPVLSFFFNRWMNQIGVDKIYRRDQKNNKCINQYVLDGFLRLSHWSESDNEIVLWPTA